MKHFKTTVFAMMAAWVTVCCERVDTDRHEELASNGYSVTDVAAMLSELPVSLENISEVHDAVTASLSNGYDEEYPMCSVFDTPGLGIGDTPDTKADIPYDSPLRALLEDYIGSKSGVDALSTSDIQIYWPYSSSWDGETYPIITFDPGYDTDRNVGYKLSPGTKAGEAAEEVIVTEEMAKTTPVWVVNLNTDRSHKTIEMMRRENPDWAEGGSITVRSQTKASNCKTLILKSLTMYRHYDCWLAGGSEFFVKCGAVEDFSASTSAEMLVYDPAVTDFLVEVPRSQLGKPIELNTILLSDWSEQLGSCAFMITEDDGGTITTWNTTAKVFIKSKSYGFDISIPFNSHDDIVWRGQLSNRYFANYSGKEGKFGEVGLVFGFD